MMRERARIRAAEGLRKARIVLSRLKQWRLSPLTAIVLASLAALTTGTALFAAAALLWPMAADNGAAAPEWNPPTLAVVELDPPKPPSADVESLSRPIFNKNRRPAPKTAAPVDSANISDAPTGLTVTAIVVNKKVAQAFMVSPESPEGAWVKIGDTLGSWTLNKILAAEVVLQSGDQLTRVKLYTPPPETGEGAPPDGLGMTPPPTSSPQPGAPPN